MGTSRPFANFSKIDKGLMTWSGKNKAGSLLISNNDIPAISL